MSTNELSAIDNLNEEEEVGKTCEENKANKKIRWLKLLNY